MRKKENPAMGPAIKPGDKLLLNTIKNTPEGKPWECPCCGQLLPFQSWEWLNEFEMLLARYGDKGVEADLPNMTISDCFSAYRYLINIQSKER